MSTRCKVSYSLVLVMRTNLCSCFDLHSRATDILNYTNNNGYSALGPVWQEPECSQATGMAPIHCNLGKFLGVVCHCFPPCLDVPTFAARCLHAFNDARDPSSERRNYGREMSGNLAYMTSLFTPLRIFYTPQIHDMGPTTLLPLRRKACWGFFRP